ncbi:hypothetical protein K6T82_11410 [Flavobacterium sp. 17A]|uniref:Uncharacterized protein n=1 Tax=Flavobacterium potami TaxID=2872310 RepID=A0A9X1KRL7_9FLAO|nr:hypothetical protein [Flavobacterium potami]MBZ4035376.1 hypothetical protein [Flavobacterium potami]
MKNSKTIDKKHCHISNTRMYAGDNDELICLKVYTGDWGDWDEKPGCSDLDNHNNFGKILKDKNSKAR